LVAVIYIPIMENKKTMEKDILIYLNKKGYTQNDIKEIKIKHNWPKTNDYSGWVVFSDEPQKKYKYAYYKDKSIYQMWGDENRKHYEISSSK
jgi:hypothetical protein